MAHLHIWIEEEDIAFAYFQGEKTLYSTVYMLFDYYFKLCAC